MVADVQELRIPAAVLGGVYLVQRSKLSRAEDQLAYLESVKNSPVFIKQYAEGKDVENALNKAESDYVFLRSTKWIVDNGSTVDRDMIVKIASFFPNGTKIIKLSISQSNVTIEGISRTLETMIDVEAALNASGSFSYVFIDTAKEDSHTDINGDDAVTFRCILTIAEKGEN